MKVLSLWESLQKIQEYRLPVVRSIIVKKDDDLTKLKRLKFPVVAKVSSPDVIHKTEVGGVILNLKSFEEAQEAYKELKSKIVARKLRLEGIVFQEMVSGYELIVGSVKDQTLGKFISFGSGGVYTELYQDVSFRRVPINKSDALEMLEETKIYKALKNGFRNRPPANLKKVVDLLLKTSKFLEKNRRIKELDLNPVFANEKGCWVTDARIVEE